MRILVTGRSGQLASCLAEAAAASGIEIVLAGRPELDLAVPDTITRAIDRYAPELVVNAAAYTAVDKAETEMDAAFAINARGAGHVATAAARAGLPILHVSTDYVFDGTKPAPYVESDPVAPTSAYGRSKREGEVRVMDANARHVILRTAWVHSPFGSNFVKTMLRLASTRPRIGVVDDQVGSPTYAPDLAMVVLGVAQSLSGRAPNDDPPWGIYHAAGRGEATWCGLAREVFAVSGRHGGPVAMVDAIPTSAYPTPARRPANSRLDTTKLKTAFALELPDWREGAAACVTRVLHDGPSASTPGTSGRT